MADEVIWQLTIDGSEALATLDEIDAGLQALNEQISQVGASSDSLVGLDDILTALQNITSAVENGFADLDGTLNQVVASVDNVEAAIQSLESTVDGLSASEQGAAAGAEEMSASFDLMAAAGDVASGAMDALNAATGPLTMIAVGAGMVGQQLFSMGVQAQNGFNLVQNMAGASDSDMQLLEASALKLGVGLNEASSGFYEVESAGFSGAGGINVFKYAEEAALASGASAKDEMSGLTAIMHDYGAQAQDAGKYTDIMTEAIVLGKQSASDFARSIGPLANMGHETGLSFQEVAAAESVLTQVNPKVAQDGMQLQGLFKALDPAITNVAKTAQGLKLKFSETHFESLDLAGKLEYLAQISGGTNTEAFIKLTGGARGSAAALALMADGGKTLTGNLDKINHSAGVTDQAFEKFKNSVQGHMDDLNASISDFSKHFVDALGPKIIPILDSITHGISQFTDYAKGHMNELLPIFAGLAAVLGGAVLGAIVGLIAAIGPVLLVLVGIGAAVAGVVYAFQHWSQIMGQVNSAMQIPAIHTIVSILQQIWGFLVASFTPVWQQLVNVFNTQLKPAFTQLWSTIQQIMPELQMLGMFIGAILVVSFGVLVAVLGGVVRALAGFLTGLATVIGGIVTMFTGVVQIVSGIVALIVDICTGHFEKLGADLGMIWQGVVNVFTGLWQVIVGVFQAAIGTVIGFISGFIDSIVGYFTNLYDILVGHSIIPDMVQGIIQWISQLPGQAMSYISQLVSSITAALGSLGSQALGWAQDMMNNFVNGILGAIGNVENAAGQVANSIKNFLHFSLPEEGPLANSDTWMPDFGDMLSKGLQDQVGKVQGASLKIASTIQTAANPTSSIPVAANGANAGATNNTQMITVLGQILSVLQQQQQRQTTLSNSMTMNNTINAPAINPQQFYALLQSMSGYGYESLARGASGI